MAQRKKREQEWVQYTDQEMAKRGELDDLHQMWNESIAKQAQAAAERQAAQYALSRFYEDSQAVAKQRELAMPNSSLFGGTTRGTEGVSFSDHARTVRETKQREMKDWVSSMSDEDLDTEIKKENPGYEVTNLLDLLTGNKTYLKDGKITRETGTPERYKALIDEKKGRESTRELEANRAEQDKLLAAYEQYTDEDLEKRSQELAGNNWAMDPDSEAHTKELNEIQKVQEIRERNKAAVEQENAKEKYQTKREEVLSEAYAKGENVEALLNEFVDIERELKASAYNSGRGIPEAVSATEKAFGSKDRLKEIGDELRRLGVDNVDVLRQYIGEKKDEEETEEKMAKIRSDIMEAKGIAPAAGYSAMDVLSELVAGPLAAAESVKRKFYADPEAPVNTSSELYLLKNMQNTTEQAANERIAKDASTAWGAKAGQMAYGVGMSTAKSMEMAALGSAVVGAAGLTGTAARVTSSLVTLPAFGTDAYATTLKEQQDRGVPTERAQQYALTSGLNEMLFEVLSMDKIYGTLHRSGKTAAKAVVLDLLANAGIEGSEEGMTDVANMITDNLINKGDSEYNRLVKDLMDQGYSMDDAKREADRQTIAKVGEDVFAGMLSGGLAGGTGNVYSAAKNNHIAEVVSQNNPEVFERLRETAKKSDPESVAYEIANSEKATEELTKDEKGSILASLAEQQEGSIETVLEEHFEELGESKEQAKADTQEIMAAVEADPEAVSEEESDARAERFTENENLSTVYGELERGEVAPVQQAVAAVDQAYRSRKNTMDNVKSVQKDSDGNFVLKMKNGNTVRPQEMNIAEQDYDTRMVLGWAMEAETPQEATQILQNRPSNVPYQQYRTAFEGIKHAAMTEVPLEQLEKSFNEYTRMLAPEQVKSIYYLGENLAKQRSERNLTGEQLKAAETIAKAAGIKVQVGGRSLAGSNGIYSPADNTIYISDKTLNPAAVVAGHEVVHSMKQNAADLYQKLNDTLVSFWKETDPSTYQRIYENRERRYADQVKEWKENGRTDAEIEDLINEEIVAHATEALFEKWGKMSQNEREDVANRMAEKDRSLAERILDFVRDLLEKFRKALQGYKANSLEARTLKENIELLENFEETFMNALQEYGARQEASGKTGELVDARGQEATGQQSENAETMHNKKGYPQSTDTKLLVYVNDFEKGKKVAPEIEVLKTTGDVEAKDVSKLLGFDVSGKKHVLLRGYLEHIIAKHGKKGKTDHSMEDNRDIARIGYIITNYDKMCLGKENKRFLNKDHSFVRSVVFQKKIKKMYHYVVVAFPDSIKENAFILSAYINKRDTLDETANPRGFADTSKTDLKSVSKSALNVPRNGEKSNGKSQKSEEKSDVRKSLKEVGEDSEGKKLTADQIEYFKDAQTVDEQGRLKRFYHGTARADRVGYFFDPERATSGPMAFFTDNKEIAERYSKDKADTSLQYEDEDVNDYHNQFAINADGEEINLVRYWNRLSQREKDRISKIAGEIGWDDDVEDFKVFPGRKNGNGGYATDPRSVRAAKGNAFLLLEDAWLESGDLFGEEERFLDILKMLGIENAVYNDPEARVEGVYETYLNITNPLRADDIDEYFAEDVQDWLDNTNLDAYKKESASADMWDKNNKDPYEWLDELRDDIKNNTTHAWTSIPDVITDFLKEYGKYDGILDQGGKYSGHGHQVAIPFYSNQIKQVTNEHPTEDVDIRFSKKELDEIDEVFEAEAQRLGEVGFMDIIRQIDMKEVDQYFKVSTARKVAKDLIDEYSSSMKAADLAAMIQATFAHWAKQGNKADYKDIVKSMVGIARPLMDQTKIVDNATKAEYDNLRAALKGKRIRLSSTQKEELRNTFDNLNVFRGKLLPYHITIADDGIPLDSLWSELVQESGYFLDTDENEGNMPIALLDTLETLKPKMGLEAYKVAGMDENEMAVDIALDIYGRFMKAVATDAENKQLQDKIKKLTNNRIEYREDIKKEYQRKYEDLKRRNEAKMTREREVFEWELAKKEELYKLARSRHDEKQAEKYKKSIEYYKNKLDETRKDRDEKLAELRARYRNNNAQRKVNYEIQQKRASVIRTAKSIGTLLSTNTDKKHVPEVLKKPVYDFISGVQYFGTGHNGPETKAELEWAEKLEKMRGILGDETKAGTNLFYTIMDHTDENGIPTSSLLGDMDRFLQSHGSEKMMEMGIDTLVELNDIMKGLKRAIDNMNQLYVNARTDSAEELTKETVREMMKKKNAKNKGFIGAALDELLNVSQLDPYSYFHRFGAAGESVYRGFRKGLNDRINMINEAQEYFSKLTEGVDISKWEDERHTFNIGDREITLTTTQIMSLYELMKRKQAEEHIIFGGIRPDDIKIKGKTVVQRGIRLTLTEAAKITDKLTEDQKRIADGIQRFMNVNVANWGNRTTMLLYGYRRFLAKDYFPIRVDKNTVDTKDTSDFYGAHKPGAAHETIEHAKNTLVLQDIFTVLTNHVVEMATYSAYSAPIMDAMKWFNGRLAPDSDIVDINTEKDGSTKGQIERVYGKKMVEYFENLVKDINNERMGDNSGTMLYNKFVGNARAAAIMFNTRVIIQQPTAFFRANAIIDPKYLAKGFFTKKEGSKSAYEHAAIAKLKNWGYYETGIGNSIRSTITGHTTTREKIVDIGMWGAGKADDFTWGRIWNAVCWETKEKHPELREGTKEFYKAVEERYDDIIDQTQVIDSVLHRSQLMRSTNWVVKNATAFMSEPTKSYNLLMNRARDWYEAKQMKDKAAMKIAGKAVIRASAAFVITGIINAAAQSLIDAMRSVGDEPEELYLDEPGERWRAYWKRFAENLLANATNNINPIELMPFVKDYAPYIVKLGQVMMGMDIEKNYSNDMSSQGLEKTLNGAQKIRKYITDPEYRDKNNIIDTFKPMLQGVSYLTGIGFYNGMRDVVAFIETLTGKRVGGWFYTDKQNQLTLADAVLLGDKEMYSKVEERMKKAGKEQKDIVPAAASGLRQKYVNGEITEDQYLQALIDAGLDPEDAYFRVEEQKYKLEKGKDASYGRYKELASPLMEGDIGTFESMKKEYLDAGMDPDKLKKETCNAITEAVKEDIKAGTLTSDRQAQYLDAYQRLGYGREDQLKKIKKWRSEKE